MISHIIFNIGQLELENGWNCFDEIEKRLNTEDLNAQYNGIVFLKCVLRSFKYEIDNKRKIIHSIIDRFFPYLEKLVLAMGSG